MRSACLRWAKPSPPASTASPPIGLADKEPGMILNRFHWLDDILLPVGVVSMRATWLFALLRTLLALSGSSGAADPLPLLTLIWLPLAATVCARMAIRESLEMRRARQLV